MPGPARDAPTVERVEVSVYTVPTDAAEADGTLAWGSTTLVLAQAISGTTIGTGWTYGSPATAEVISKELVEVVTDRSVFDVPGANETMSRAVRNTGRPGLVAGAISAVDIALWDLKAHLLKLPLVRLLGATVTDVPVYGSGGFTTYDEDQLTRQLRDWTRERGIPRVKIKIGESWGQEPERDLARVRQARQVIGDSCELYVDANGGYTRKQAVRMADAFAGQNVTWYEEPVSSDDLTGLRMVRDAVRSDVTAGEYGYDLPYLTRMAASGAVDCLQADVTRCGGITVWLRAAAVAEGLGLQISGHCAPHLHADVAAAVPNLRHLEWFHDHVRIEQELFEGGLDPSGGSVRPGASGEPGHGLTFRHAQAARFRTG
ncbi:mandelate racemase [Streptomyces sp. NA02950]|uniref:enolase C-terminal domain-like protein n=1 Tax=Streptomyces sp. NA02950 TaxID=2742137 RepID=UPI0015906DE1|nr:enolase C-terminal domain-like protein [Streptomyces sp. NA02950]QKV90661.1 mandelate racemase [Streptomyces sp. NA02950]